MVFEGGIISPWSLTRASQSHHLTGRVFVLLGFAVESGAQHGALPATVSHGRVLGTGSTGRTLEKNNKDWNTAPLSSVASVWVRSCLLSQGRVVFGKLSIFLDHVQTFGKSSTDCVSLPLLLPPTVPRNCFYWGEWWSNTSMLRSPGLFHFLQTTSGVRRSWWYLNPIRSLHTGVKFYISDLFRLELLVGAGVVVFVNQQTHLTRLIIHYTLRGSLKTSNCSVCVYALGRCARPQMCVYVKLCVCNSSLKLMKCHHPVRPAFSRSNSHCSVMKYLLSFHRLCVSVFILSCCRRTVLKVFWQSFLEERARHAPAEAIMSSASVGSTDLITQCPQLIFIPPLESRSGSERQGGDVEVGRVKASSGWRCCLRWRCPPPSLRKTLLN